MVKLEEERASVPAMKGTRKERGSTEGRHVRAQEDVRNRRGKELPGA